MPDNGNQQEDRNLMGWLDQKEEKIVEGAKKSNDNSLEIKWEEGLYSCQVTQNEIKMSGSKKPGHWFSATALEGEYAGEKVTLYSDMTRDDAWTWFAQAMKSCGVVIADPASMPADVRANVKDIYGLVEANTVVVIEVVDTVSKKDGQTYRNARVKRKIDDWSADGAGYGSGRDENPEDNSGGVDLEVGMEASFKTTDKKNKEVIKQGTIKALDSENQKLTITDADGNDHEIPVSDLTAAGHPEPA